MGTFDIQAPARPARVRRGPGWVDGSGVAWPAPEDAVRSNVSRAALAAGVNAMLSATIGRSVADHRERLVSWMVANRQPLLEALGPPAAAERPLLWLDEVGAAWGTPQRAAEENLRRDLQRIRWTHTYGEPLPSDSLVPWIVRNRAALLAALLDADADGGGA